MTSSTPADALPALRRVHAVAQVGDGAFYVTSAAFLLRQGWSAPTVGIALAVAWGVGALAAPRLGRLADRLGLRQVSVAATSGCALALSLLALGPAALLVPALVLYAVAQSAWGGLRATLVHLLADPADRVAERARQQVVGNTAVTLGALVGGAALAAGNTVALRLVLLADATAYLIASLHVQRHVAVAARDTDSPSASRPHLTARHWVATGAAAALYLYMPLLSVALPLLVVGSRAPDWAIAACFALNTVGVLAAQTRAARWAADRARTAVLVGGALLALSCALLWSAASVGAMALAMLLVAVVVQVAGEVLFAAAAWDVGHRLAPEGGVAAWQATYGAAIPVARCVGPALLAPLVALPLGWVAPAALFVGGAAALAAAARAGTSLPAAVAPRPVAAGG